MKNTTRAICLLSACCITGSVAIGAVFQAAPDQPPAQQQPPTPQRRVLPPRQIQSPPLASPQPDLVPDEALPQAVRWVYGQVFYGSLTHRSGDPWPVKPRERGLVRSFIADPKPIPPLRVRYAVISLYVPGPRVRPGASYPEPLLTWIDINKGSIEAALDADAQEVLSVLRRRYPHARFRLDFTGEVKPAADGTWHEDRRGPGVDRSQIFLGHDGVIFDAGLLPTGEMAVQMEIDSNMTRFADGGWRGVGGGGGGGLTWVLGRTYALSQTGPSLPERPSSHLFLVCLVPSQSAKEQPRIPEAVYKVPRSLARP